MSDQTKTARYWVERHDDEDGSITYEVWCNPPYYRVCSISDDVTGDPHAKRDSERIAEMFNRYGAGRQ